MYSCNKKETAKILTELREQTKPWSVMPLQAPARKRSGPYSYNPGGHMGQKSGTNWPSPVLYTITGTVACAALVDVAKNGFELLTKLAHFVLQ